MKWRRHAVRVVVGCLLLVSLFIIGIVLFQQVQFSRAQKMLSAFHRTAIVGMIRSSQLDKFVSDDEVERVWNECEKHPHNFFALNQGRRVTNGVPVPVGLHD
jgi:hypothetical protein